ncbi:MAG: heme biosynthesis HemY N-terminal domain-containing protein [Gammaproteobacteria bacterium]
MRRFGLKLLLLILLALLAAVGIGLFAHDYPGHMVIRLPGWRVETSLSFFIVALLVTLFLFYTGVRLLLGTLRFPGRVLHWQSGRKRLRAERYLRNGLLALIEGDWKRAERLLQRGAPSSRAPLINYLAAARAAQEQGALERRDNFLRLAHQQAPNNDIIIGIAQAELQMNQHQTEQALATLKHLNDRQPDQAHVQQLLVQTYSQVGDWEAVLQLLPQLARARLLSEQQRHDLEIKAYSGLLTRAGVARRRDALDTIWNDIPRRLRQESILIETYVSECLRINHTGKSENLLRTALKKSWHPGLMSLYGRIEAEDTGKQLAFAEKFLKEYAHESVLLLALARLSLRNGLWGKARSYLHQAIELQPTPEAYRELADLLRQQGEHTEAARFYQKGLVLATGGNRERLLSLEDQQGESNADVARRVV